MRKIFICLFLLLALMVIALVAAPSLVDVNQYRGRIEAEAQQRLGRPVKLGQLRLTLLPLAFRAENASIGEGPHFGNGQFAHVQDLYLRVKLWPLLHKAVQISSLDLRQARIEVIRNAQGRWNFSTIGHQAETALPSRPPSPKPPSQLELSKPPSQQPEQNGTFSLDHLRIADGTLALTDYQKGQSRVVYDHIDIDLSNFTPGQPFTIASAVRLPGKGSQLARLAGKIGPINHETILATPLDATLKLKNVQLSGIQRFLNTTTTLGETDAAVSGTMSVRNEIKSLTSAGVITLEQVHIKGSDVGYPIDADYKVSNDLNNDVLRIDKGDVKLGSTPLSITGTINTKATPPELDVQLRTPDASIAELTRLAARFGMVLNPGMQLSGNVSADIHALGQADKPAVNGVLNARTVQISGSGAPQPVRANDVNLALTPQTIQSNEFTATTGNIAVAVQFAITDYTTSNPQISAAMRTNNANLAELLNIVKHQGVAAVNDVTGEGVLSLDTRVNGPLKNVSALAFSGTGQVRDATLKAPSLIQPVRVSNMNLVFTPQRIQSNDFTATSGNIALGLRFAMSAYTTSNPQIDAAIRMNNASVADLLNLAKQYAVKGMEGVTGAGVLNLDARINGPLKNASALAFSGSGQARDATIKTPSLPKPVSLRTANLSLTTNTAALDNINASIGGTNISGGVTVRNFAPPGAPFTMAAYRTSNPQINATLHTANADIAELLSLAKSYGITPGGIAGAGMLSLDVRGNGPLKNAAALVFTGTGQIHDATMTTSSLSKPVNIRAVNVNFTPNSVTFNNLNASIGGTNASGNMTVRNFAAPVVQFTLAADKVSVDELRQLTAEPAPAKAAANWSLVLRAQAQTNAAGEPSFLEKMTGAGSVTVGTVLYDQLVLNNVRSNVTLERGLIRLSPVTAQLYGGQQTGTVILDVRQKPPVVSVTSDFRKVDSNQLLSSTSPLKDTLYGLLSANSNASFRASSANDIARNLNGKLSLDLDKGKIAHVDILNQLAMVGRFALSGKENASQPFTDLVKLTGGFDINNGVAQTNNLKGVIEGGTLAAQGAVNLVNQSLDMHVTAVLSKAMSDKVGGTGVGGYMNTALANQHGELVIPVIVTGTLQNPQFAPDVQKVAEMKLRNLLPSESNPAQATTRVLGQVLGNANQQGGLGGVVGTVLGGQQEKGQPAANQPASNQPPANQPAANPQQQSQPQSQQSQQPAPAQQQQPQKKKALDILQDILKQQQEQQQKEPPKQQPPPR